MAYDELINYDHTQPNSHLAPAGLAHGVHQSTGDPNGVNAPIHMGSSPPVIVEAQPVKITGVHETLAGEANTETGKHYSGEHAGFEAEREANLPPYNGTYGYGNARVGYRTAQQAREAQVRPVYNESLTTNEGPEIPMGTSEMSPMERMNMPGVAEGVAAHGSISDIRNYQRLTGKQLPVSDDVRAAVDKNMAPEYPVK